MNWLGWIGGCEETDREYLESLGITVGPYDPKSCCFEDCVAPQEALEILEPLWSDPYLWGLISEDDEVFWGLSEGDEQ